MPLHRGALYPHTNANPRSQAGASRRPREPAAGFLRYVWFPAQEILMHLLTDAHITPIVALIAGILILIAPRILNFVVAIYLIVVGLVGLNAIHHFVH
jgi:uncharacterized metal-binding protein